MPADEAETAYMLRFSGLDENRLESLKTAYGSIETVSRTGSETVVITPVRKIKKHREIIAGLGSEFSPVSIISVF